MLLLNPEQQNAVRLSAFRGEFLQSMRVATGPLRLRLRRTGKRIARKPLATDSALWNTPVPELSAVIHPLFVRRASTLGTPGEINRLFLEVDRQLYGEFRLAGGKYQRVEFRPADEFDEIEDQHALDRLYWAARFARASAFGHPKAYAGLSSAWTKWRHSTKAATAFAAYTIAERIASLSESLFWLGHNSDTNSTQAMEMKQQIWKDASRLSTHIEYGLGVHNHILNDARGLFRASRMLPDVAEAAAWQALAFELWDNYFPQLVLDDGTFDEQSSHYHVLLCRTALEYFIAAQLCQRPLPSGWDLRLRKMFQLANDLLRSDGSLPRFGDNSPDHTVEDLWGLLSAAYHFGLLSERPRHGVTTALTLMYCGAEPQHSETSPAPISACYPLGGFMFLNSNDRSVQVTVHGDPNSKPRAHGDSGRGSFEVWWQGDLIVTEPGSILSASNTRSAWSRSGQAQNVTCLNGLSPSVTFNDRRFLPATYANGGGSWTTQSERRIAFRWDGFSRVNEDIVLWRTWSFDGAGDLVLEEKIDGHGEVRFESRLFLGQGRWRLYRDCTDGAAQLRWIDAQGRSVVCNLSLPVGVSPSLISGHCFPEFGREKEIPLLSFSGTVTLPVRWSAKWQFCAAPSETSLGKAQPCAG